MQRFATAALLGAGLLGYASAQSVGTSCVSGSSPNVCLNPSVTSLLDANANVVLVCTNNTYVASLCQANEGCQNGACVNLVGPSNVASVTSATTTSPPLASVGVGLPCTVGSSPDVCLNPDVTSLTDANANVLLTCVNGFYTETVCVQGEVCQGGTCVLLAGTASASNSPIITLTSPSVTLITGPTGTDSITAAPTDTGATLTGTDDATGRSLSSSIASDLSSVLSVSSALESSALSLSASSASATGTAAPTGDVAPDSRSLTAAPSGLTTVTVPAIYIYATEYVTISQFINGQWQYATWCNEYPICDVCEKPPVYQYKTSYNTVRKCAACQPEVETVIYPYCDTCEVATECVVTTTPGCACTESTITIVPGKTTSKAVPKTATITCSTTIQYPTPSCTTCAVASPPACTTCGASTPTPKPPVVFISGASTVDSNAFIGIVAFISFLVMVIAM